MTHPRHIAETAPDHTAILIEPSGHEVSYATLEARANQAAHLFRSLGIKKGDKVALCLENCHQVFESAWGAHRAGLYFVPISNRLTANEVLYILQDSGSKLLLSSDAVSADLDEIAQSAGDLVLTKTGAAREDWLDWEGCLRRMPSDPISDESRGAIMFYSSGTTGRPKGITPAPLGDDAPEAPEPLPQLVQSLFDANDQDFYLCPAPLYHAAPLSWSMALQRAGVTIIVMEKFDAEAALSLIETHRITCGQFVPTHFVRMLKLPDDVRLKYDISSLKAVVHAAAPCPVPVKEGMIEWWGPIVSEYYAGSEANGLTYITASEWLDKKGSVGRPLMGTLHICDEEGNEVPVGAEGQVFFEGGSSFSYHNDAEKTAQSRNQHGWTSLGDVGRVDEDGYLFLTDRKSFMIISGGVNIYPQEIENHLITHPEIVDVAVVGGPHPDMGEEVVAFVQPVNLSAADDAFKARLESFCRSALSGVKTPRRFEFRETLPRTPTGKLIKRALRDALWKDTGA